MHRRWLWWCIFGVLYPARCAVDLGVNFKLLQCFDYKRNFWLVGYAFHTSSVQVRPLLICSHSP